MEHEQWIKVRVRFDRRIEFHKKQIVILEAQRDKTAKQLEEQCLKEHGQHLDNGGFMYGFCVRCGAHLG